MTVRRGLGRSPLGVAWLLCVLSAAPEVDAGEDSWLGFDFSVWMLNRFNYKQNFLNTDWSMTASGRVGFPGSSGRGRPGGALADQHYEDPLSLRFDKDELGYSVLVGAAARLQLGESVGLVLNLDSGELKLPWLIRYQPTPDCRSDDPRCEVTANGRPVTDEASATFFVRQAYLDWSLGSDAWFSARAGKVLLSVGDGFIMDSYALGMSARFDLDLGFGLPVKIVADLVLPDGSFSSEGKRSPLACLDLAYPLSFFEEIGLFFAWYHDGDDSLANVLTSIVRENAYVSGNLQRYTDLTYEGLPLVTRGDLFWVGLRANRVFARASLSGTAILELGRIDQAVAGETRSAGVLAGALDANFHYDVADWLTLGAFFLFLSGETGSADEVSGRLAGSYHSFIAVYPYITHTNLFFQGGMNQNFSARSFSTSGVNGRGVLAPGLTAGIELSERITMRLVSAALFAHGAHLLSAERFYGWESDLNFRWQINKVFRLLVEADYMLTGGFFDFEKPVCVPYEGTGFRVECGPSAPVDEPSTWKIMLGLDVVY